MKIVFFETFEKCQQWRVEYDLDCPDHVVQAIQAGTHPDYDTLEEWAQDQGREIADREIADPHFEVFDGDCGVQEAAE